MPKSIQNLLCSLGLLVKRVDEAQIDFLVNRLGGMVTAGKQAQDREISSLGLKAIVADLPPSSKGTQNVVKILSPLLLKGLASKVRASQGPLPGTIAMQGTMQGRGIATVIQGHSAIALLLLPLIVSHCGL